MFFQNVSRRALPYDFIKQDSTTEVFEKTWYVSIFFQDKKSTFFLASQINCCCRAVQGQPSKFIWINTVTSFRTQLKSHKDLKGAVVFTRRCFTIKLIWKIPQNIHSKETVMKYFFQLNRNQQLYWKRTPSQLFSDNFRKSFIILFCIKTLVNLVKVLNEQEHSPKMLKKKTGLNDFTKFSQKKLWWSPFFS